jgi:PAS domain S-box-containing protein
MLTNGEAPGARADEARSARVARILVVQAPDQGPRLARSLAALTGHTTVQIVHDAATCLERCAAGDVDVLLLDARREAEALRVLEATRRLGPPAIVIEAGGGDAGCLAWFRSGAVDCLPAGDVAERLSGSILRQLEREEARRERDEASGRGANRAVMDHLNSALLVIDADGAIAYANPAAEQILGAEGDRLHGASVWEWFRGEPREDAPIARSLRGERLKGAEALLTRGDGSVRLVGLSCAPIGRAGAGPLSGAVAIFQDLSEMVQRRNHALQTEKLASIGQLAAGVAHEINNPMGFIHANLFQMAEYVNDLRQVWSRVDGLRRAIAGGQAGEVDAASRALEEASEEADVAFVLSDLTKAIRESQEGSERIRHIVQDLRDFSHQDTGQRAPSDLNQCLDSTANIVWPMMKHVVVLEKHYAELPPVPCFAMQLKQVFMNLLVNAFQAIEEEVGSSGRTGTITLTTAVEGDDVVVSIADTGVGIPAENLDRIFDPFFTTKKVGAGTGLGLSTSFGIVQRHGGTLSVDSQPGRGSRFRLRLPLEPPDESADGDA